MGLGILSDRWYTWARTYAHAFAHAHLHTNTDAAHTHTSTTHMTNMASAVCSAREGRRGAPAHNHTPPPNSPTLYACNTALREAVGLGSTIGVGAYCFRLIPNNPASFRSTGYSHGHIMPPLP